MTIIDIDSPETLASIFGDGPEEQGLFINDVRTQLALNNFSAWQIGALRQAYKDNALLGLRTVWDDIKNPNIDVSDFQKLHQTAINFEVTDSTIAAHHESDLAP